MKTSSRPSILTGIISRLKKYRKTSSRHTNPSILLVLSICLIAFNGISQGKVIDQQAQFEKLATIEENIQKLDERITAINNRLGSAPAGATIDPEVIANLNALEQERKRYEGVKYSIEAATNPTGFTPAQSEPVEIPQSQFDLMPLENQTQILAHPERFTVIANQ